MEKVNLKWRNRFSKEEGYVKSISMKNGCFYNTFNKEEAKTYSFNKALEKDLAFMEKIEETKQNEFFTEKAEDCI